MKVAVMQPYFFPYLGYFQLLYSVDKFVFYDDVQFIKGGWINRNKILINKAPAYFGVQMIGASSNKNICQIEVNKNPRIVENLLRKVKLNYSRSPYFNSTYELIKEVLNSEENNLGKVAADSVEKTASYLGLNKIFYMSSDLSYDGNERSQKLINLIKVLNGDTYINSSGGKSLYDSSTFTQQGIDLKFIRTELPYYRQGNDTFYPGLSIIDVLMNNSKDEVLQMLTDYSLD